MSQGPCLPHCRVNALASRDRAGSAPVSASVHPTPVPTPRLLSHHLSRTWLHFPAFLAVPLISLVMGIPDTPVLILQHSLWSIYPEPLPLSTSHPGVTSPSSSPHHLNNTHFPVISPCGKGQERGKGGNMEDRHLIQEGFLEEVMPKLNLKG